MGVSNSYNNKQNMKSYITVTANFNLFGDGGGRRGAGNLDYYLIGPEMNWKMRQRFRRVGMYRT